MSLPLSISDIGLWLAVTSIILLVTSELFLSSRRLSMRLSIEKKRLRLAATGCGIVFLITVLIRVL